MRHSNVLSSLIMAAFCIAVCELKIAKHSGSGSHDTHAVDDGKVHFNDLAGQPDKFPWTVMIFLKIWYKNTEYIKKHQCDGALIHPRAVLVPVNCVDRINKEDLTVRAGGFDASSESEINHYEEKTVSKVMEQGNEDPWQFPFTVAIVILSSPFELNENIRVVSVPRKNDEYDRSRCIVSGWTKNSNACTGCNGYELKRASVPIVSDDVCRNIYQAFSDVNGILVQPSSCAVCAGSQEHPDLCPSNNGSPLICPLASNPSRYVLVGLRVLNFACKITPFVPSQFANVGNARDWIDARMMENGLDRSAYGAS